jgi:hypothetical protein
LAGYKVYRGSLPVKAVGGAGFTDNDLQPNSAYIYSIVAFDNAGNHSASSGTLSFSTSDGTPAAPTNLSASRISASQINLSWTDNSDNETGFKIERKIGGGGNYVEIATVGPSISSFPNTSLAVQFQHRLPRKLGQFEHHYSRLQPDGALDEGTIILHCKSVCPWEHLSLFLLIGPKSR